MSNDTVVKLIQPGTFSDQLTDILRQGAHALLAQAVRASGVPLTAKVLDIGCHHGLQGLDPRRQAEPPEAGVHSLPRLFHARRDGKRANRCRLRHGVAFLHGIYTRSLTAQGKQRRPPNFNIRRGIPPAIVVAHSFLKY